MSTRIVTNGQDPLTKPIMDYLTDRYDIPLDHICGVRLDSHVNDVQTVTVILTVQEVDESAAEPVIAEETVMVPFVGQTRDEQPRSQCADDDCSMPEHRISHAPTTCAYMLPVGVDLAARHPCGELIRWHTDECDVSTPLEPHRVIPGRGYWVHVSDGRLGTSAHPATPGA
jgi:hypothetical protein